MQISSRFTIAIHIFACIEVFGKEHKLTSDFLAGSINVNPVIIRCILQQLKSADLIKVSRGSGGASITKPLSEITLLDVYNAVECVDEVGLFHFHKNPNSECPVGRNIHNSLDPKLERIQKAFESEMNKITMETVVKDTKRYIRQGENMRGNNL